MKKKIQLLFKRHKYVYVVAMLVGMSMDILFFKGNSDLRIYSILGIYIIGIFIYKLSSRFAFIVSLFVLVMMYVQFLLTGPSEQAEKAAVWLFFLIGIGLMQQLKE